MADRALDKKLAQAEKAYRKRDKHSGARLVDEILQEDFNHPGAWELLYRLYGRGRTYSYFRQDFAAQYYPERLGELEPEETFQRPVPPQKKPNFLQRLFGLGKQEQLEGDLDARLPSAGEASAEVPGNPPASSPAKVKAPEKAQAGSSISPRPATTGEEERIGTIKTPVFSGVNLPEGQRIRLVLVDDISQTRETIIRSLRFQENIEVVGTASNGKQAIQLARELRPDVMVIDVNMPDMDGITATATIKRDTPATEIVILTVQDDIDYMRRSMLAGARDFLTKPPMIDELVQAVERAGAQAFQNRLRHPEMSAFTLSTQEEARSGKIISVFSPRGGAGCTLLAVNLALGLQRGDTPAVLVDGDLLYGDVPVQLNTQSDHSILDLAPRVDELDADIIDEVLVAHPSGVKALHPPRPERAELVTGPQFSQLLKYLARLYRYVIVDTSHRLSEITMASLDASDLIVLVSTLDIPSIARVRKFLELSSVLNLEAARINLVVNQFDPRIGIVQEKLPQAFGRDPVGIVPLAYALAIESVNRGSPILAQRATAEQPAGQAIMQVVKHVRTQLRELEKAPTA
jgi:pilus assembly protein CpaE